MRPTWMIGVRVAIVITCAAIVTACGFVAPPVAVQGTPVMLEQLAGEWWGDYVGDRLHGRNGTIVFKLVAGDDHAHGDVVMTPSGSDRPYGQRRETDRDLALRSLEETASNVLTIRFLTALDGTISGELDPYWDPDRETSATTRFVGGWTGDDTIGGTFTTRYADGQPSTEGRWTVKRQQPHLSQDRPAH